MCDHTVEFNNSINQINVMGDVCFNSVECNKLRTVNMNTDSLILQGIDIIEGINDLCANIVDGSFSVNSENRLGNSMITNELALKQNTITDVSNDLWLSPGTNIVFGLNGQTLNINKYSSTTPVYFIAYFTGNYGGTYAGPNRIQINSILYQDPSSGTLNNDGYVIQETGLYKLGYQIRVNNDTMLTQTAVAITRSGVTIYAKVGGESLVTSKDGVILYPCEQGDEVSVMTTHFTLFDERTAYYGSNGGTRIQTFIYGTKIG